LCQSRKAAGEHDENRDKDEQSVNQRSPLGTPCPSWLMADGQ
jgi:hypothetical protein